MKKIKIQVEFTDLKDALSLETRHLIDVINWIESTLKERFPHYQITIEPILETITIHRAPPMVNSAQPATQIKTETETETKETTGLLGTKTQKTSKTKETKETK